MERKKKALTAGARAATKSGRVFFLIRCNVGALLAATSTVHGAVARDNPVAWNKQRQERAVNSGGTQQTTSDATALARLPDRISEHYCVVRVEIAKGTLLDVEGYGRLELLVNQPDANKTATTVHKVAFVPELRRTLLSANHRSEKKKRDASHLLLAP